MPPQPHAQMDAEICKDPGQVSRPQDNTTVAAGKRVLNPTNSTCSGNRKQREIPVREMCCDQKHPKR